MGTIDQHVFDARMRNLEMWLNNEGGMAAWKGAKAVFSQEYTDYVQEHVIHE